MRNSISRRALSAVLAATMVVTNISPSMTSMAYAYEMSTEGVERYDQGEYGGDYYEDFTSGKSVEVTQPSNDSAKEEAEKLRAAEAVPQEAGVGSSGTSGGKININTADAALLTQIPGVGESKAKSIIAYRDEHGPFKSTEDLMKVSGIAAASFEKMRDYITAE